MHNRKIFNISGKGIQSSQHLLSFVTIDIKTQINNNSVCLVDSSLVSKLLKSEKIHLFDLFEVATCQDDAF